MPFWASCLVVPVGTLRRIQLSAVALALLIPGAYLNGLLPNTQSTTQGFEFSVPAQVGPWSVTAEDRLDIRSAEMLEPTSYVLRRYDAPGKTPIHAYVAFYAERAGSAKGAHNPEICYPSGGWNMLGSESLELHASESETFRATLLDMRRAAANEIVLYWFQPAERWPSTQTMEQLLFVYDAVAGRPQHAFVRLVASQPAASERAQAIADLEAFAQELAWPVRAALSPAEQPTTSGHARVDPKRHEIR